MSMNGWYAWLVLEAKGISDENAPRSHMLLHIYEDFWPSAGAHVPDGCSTTKVLTA
jgi:hypothetical protein